MIERTVEEQRAYEKSRMLHFAAQLSQIRHELSEFNKNEHKGSLSASHAMGVTLGSLGYAVTNLTKWAGQ